jgi:GntP family gluconate:H+ symporter
MKIIVLAVCLATGLYSAHVFVPPTPGPLAAAAILKADIGLLLIVGLFSGILVSIGGYLWIKIFFPDDFKIDMKTLDVQLYSYNKSFIIFFPIVIPILLISLSTLIKYPIFEISESLVLTCIIFIGKPEVALLIGIVISSFFIKKTNLIETPKWILDSLKKSFDILLIPGAGGAFGFIIRSSGLIDSINLDNANGLISIVTVFIISASIKTIQGSSTVALITTCALVAPIIESLTIISEIEKVIFIISIGSGAMTVSHVNDSYFWVVSKYSNLKMNETLRFFSSATLVQGLFGLLISITLYIFLT